MAEEQTFISFEPNDFIIRISPVMQGDEWNGDINVGQVTTNENNLSNTDYLQLSILTEMLICAIQLIEKDESVRKELFKLAQESSKERQPKVTERDGNVIKVNF